MTERHPWRGNSSKARHKMAPAIVETLEGRQLLAYTPLGFSIPDLAILDAYSGPVAAFGGPLSITVDVSNLGQSSMPEPFAQFPGSPSTADAGPSEIAVYLTADPHFPFRNRVQIGTIDVPSIPQNRLAQVTGTFTLPDSPPPGFPTTGGVGFLTLELDPDREIRDLDRTNNVFRTATPFQLIPNLPELQAVALGLPPVMNPGDTIVPQVKIANYGAAPTNLQAPVVVQVVASQDPFFGPGDIVLGTFTVDNILPLSQAPTQHFVPGDVNVIDPPNFVTLDAMQAVALPDTGGPYYVGVVIDPLDEIQQITNDENRLQLPQLVTNSGLGLPPAGVIGEPTDQPFPFPPFNTPTGTPDPVFVPVTEPQPIGPILRSARGDRTLAQLRADRLQALQAREQNVPVRAARVALPGDLAARLAARRVSRGPIGQF